MTKCKFLGVLLVVLLWAAPSVAADETDHLVSVLTSSSDEIQMMSLILTGRYARAGGSAQLLLCDRAGELALSGSNYGGRPIDPPAR